MKEPHPFVTYFNNHPREGLQLLLLALCAIWQTGVAFISLGLFLILIRSFRLSWKILLPLGLLIGVMALCFEAHSSHIIAQGFIINKTCWVLFLKGHTQALLHYLYQNDFNFLVGLPLFMTGLLSILELIPTNRHEEKLKALQQAKEIQAKELTDKVIAKLLQRLPDSHSAGTLLGVSKTTGMTVMIPDSTVNQMVLVLGTTGGGKTVTLRRFYQQAASQCYPLLIVDGKPTEENVQWLMRLAEKTGRPFYGFNCGNHYHYNALAQGGHTELKDKIMCLKDVWENDYYFSIAEDYLQTAIEVILQSGQPCELKTIADCLSYKKLLLLVRHTENPVLVERVQRLENYQSQDLTGLQAHLNVLIHSELGELLQINEQTFSLPSAIAQNAIVYFALPALRYPHFSKVLGKLIINDIKTVIDRRTQTQPVFTIFDEFSVFAGQQVLNLVNMGRGKGVHAIFGTQGLADLKAVDPNFESQLLNCVNTLICHRLNDQESMEKVCAWVGTQDIFDVTAQINLQQQGSGLGSV